MTEPGPPVCERHQIPKTRRDRKDRPSPIWECRLCSNQRINEYKSQTPEAVLDSKLWGFYRIRAAQYWRMMAEQGNRCAACGAHITELVNKYPAQSLGFFGIGLVVDHDHQCCPTRSTGKRRACGRCVRGLLCPGCNSAAGMLNDSPERLEQLAAYLRRYRSRRPPVDESGP